MWFAGLLLGALIGSLDGSIKAFVGAIIGAVAGAIIGAALKSRGAGADRQQRDAAVDAKLKHIYKSLEDVHRRLLRLERPDVQPATDGVDATAPIQPAPIVPLEAVAPAAAVQYPAPAQSAPFPPPEAPAAKAVRAREAAPAHVEVAPPPVQTSSPFVERGPSWWHRLFAGNIVAKAGVVILFFGVSFLLKYAYEHAVLPVPVRLAGVAFIGVAMLAGGWRLLARRRLYGLILQGAGIGLLYLDVFFALRVFTLIPPAAGFALFMLLGIAATLLAVRQDAKVLAVLGLSGAFLAPVLAGSREGNHVMLFSYYALLNGFIVVISWFKSWRDLNLTGFLFTFVVALLWGGNNYRPELFATVEPFVLIFFATYLIIPILFAARQPPELKGIVDGTLVFGTPLSAAFMQAALVRDMPYGLAWSAGCAAALYAVLALLVIRRNGMRLLGETYIALSVVFATMTIFFALDAYPTFALWTLEGAAVVWVGLRQRRLLARLFGIALQFGGAALFMLNTGGIERASPWFNDFVLGCMLIAVAGMVTSRLMHLHREVLIEGGERAAAVLLVWACGWWAYGGLTALHDGVSPLHFHAAAMIFAAVSFALAETLGGWLAWPTLRLITTVHIAALFIGMVASDTPHPLAGLGIVAWPLNFIVFFWCLHWQRRDCLAAGDSVRYRLGWIALALLATWEGVWLLDHHHFRWAWALGALGIIAGWLRHELRERAGSAARLSDLILLWGLSFWLLAGIGYLRENMVSELHIAAGLAYLSASCVLFEILGGWLRWPSLRRTELMLMPSMLLALLLQLERNVHPGAGFGWLAWLTAFVAFYTVLYRQESAKIATGAVVQHVLAVWLATGLVAWELAWQMAQASPQSSWPLAMWGLVPAISCYLLVVYGAAIWPWRVNAATYRRACAEPMIWYLVAWSLVAALDPGRPAPLPYVPLLNPVDLAQAAVLLALVAWLQTAGPAARSHRIVLIAGLMFIWLNAIVLRSIHHWDGVPYNAHALFASLTVQAALSLLWTATAMALMLFATRTVRRPLWFAGVALLAVVIGKLILLDLANSGTIARIVSFLGVGGLVMLIGYAAPVPPGESENGAA